jgi:hypothetical protein
VDVTDPSLFNDQLDKLMDQHKYETPDHIVFRINECLHAIREMVYDLNHLAASESDAAAVSNGAAGDSDDQELRSKVPALIQHRCPSLVKEQDSKGDSCTTSSWLQLEQKVWHLKSEMSKYRKDRMSERVIKSLEKLKLSEQTLHRMKSDRHMHEVDKIGGLTERT